jgi:hypothetical protein
MGTTMFRVTDESIYVGERVYVEIQIFNPRTREPASALAPELTFTHQGGTAIDGGNMVEVEAGSGVYSGSVVVTEDGKWRVTVEVGAPFESKWVYDKLYVNP